MHYKQSIVAEQNLSPLFRDVFLYHWREESQHAIIDVIEWAREDTKLDEAARDAAVDDLVSLFCAIDQVLQDQTQADVEYFLNISSRRFGAARQLRLYEATLAAYRWQYIITGLRLPRYVQTLTDMLSPAQYKSLINRLQFIWTENSVH